MLKISKFVWQNPIYFIMSIVVEDVTKVYGQQKALDQVSFNVKPGEIVGFLGPNGAGKSTMMKIITGFIPATKGNVSVCNFSINDEALKVKEKVGYLAEQNPLYYDMYVREYLSFLAGIFKLKDKKNRIDEMIETVGLRLEQNKKIGALSKGYKQRVGLAQALIHDPEVLILDEPTTGLDPNQLEEIRGLIKKIGAEKTVMLSTHIMQEVEAICNRIIIINHGKIVANETPSELKNTKSSNIVLSVEFNKQVVEKELIAIEGIVRIKEKPQQNSWLIEIENDSIRNHVFQYALENEIVVLSINEEKESLEEVFKKLTVS